MAAIASTWPENTPKLARRMTTLRTPATTANPASPAIRAAARFRLAHGRGSEAAQGRRTAGWSWSAVVPHPPEQAPSLVARCEPDLPVPPGRRPAPARALVGGDGNTAA